MRRTGLLARNVLWNLAGQGAPIAAAFFAIPALTRGLGTDRFGILTLAWVFLGYFSLFDLGLGRALTQAVSERLGRGETEDVASIAWTSLAAMGLLGLVATLGSALAAPLIVTHALKVPPELRRETERAFYVLAASIPVVILTSGFRGLLEARHRFDLSNAIRMPLSLLMLLSPLAVLPFDHDLFVIVGLLLLVRIVGLFVHAYFAARVVPGLFKRPVLRLDAMRPLLATGGWMTVSNIVSPLLASLDRFVIGGVASMSAVAYYTAPYEAVTKLWLVPVAISNALFPEFAATFSRDPVRGARLYRRSVTTLLLVLFPITLVIVAFARVGLKLWLGPVFAQRSTVLLQVLAAGVLINSLASVPFTLAQGVGRPDLTAKLHLAELAPFVGLLWILVERFGIVGAAIAWTARCTVDSVVLFIVGRRMLPKGHASLVPIAMACAAAAGLLVVAALAATPWLQFGVVVIGVPVFLVCGVTWLLDRDDIAAILARVPLRAARARTEQAG